MTYEIYRYIFMGGAVASILMLLVTVFVFVYLRIPTVIGDLTGTNARRGIEEIRNKNESTGEKVYRSSTVNKERGRITDKISSSGRLIKQKSEPLYGAMETGKLNTGKLSRDAANATTVLETAQPRASETVVLTSELTRTQSETTVLDTAPVQEKFPFAQPAAADTSQSFVIEYELTYIHTREIIS